MHELPAQPLHEVVPTRPFRARADVPVANTPFRVAALATIFVDDELTAVSPVPLTPSVRGQVRELGLCVAFELIDGIGWLSYLVDFVRYAVKSA